MATPSAACNAGTISDSSIEQGQYVLSRFPVSYKPFQRKVKIHTAAMDPPPCDGCQLEGQCKFMGSTCRAFLAYEQTGKYLDEDIGTLSRFTKNRRV